MSTSFFINGKKYSTEGKSLAQLEHMLQLANDEVTRYKRTISNYPAERLEKFGIPHLNKLQSAVATIEKAIQDK
jgi:hypothetical protein